jgi:hypothetical protein
MTPLVLSPLQLCALCRLLAWRVFVKVLDCYLFLVVRQGCLDFEDHVVACTGRELYLAPYGELDVAVYILVYSCVIIPKHITRLTRIYI